MVRIEISVPIAITIYKNRISFSNLHQHVQFQPSLRVRHLSRFEKQIMYMISITHQKQSKYDSGFQVNTFKCLHDVHGIKQAFEKISSCDKEPGKNSRTPKITSF